MVSVDVLADDANLSERQGLCQSMGVLDRSLIAKGCVNQWVSSIASLDRFTIARVDVLADDANLSERQGLCQSMGVLDRSSERQGLCQSMGVLDRSLTHRQGLCQSMGVLDRSR